MYRLTHEISEVNWGAAEIVTHSVNQWLLLTRNSSDNQLVNLIGR